MKFIHSLAALGLATALNLAHALISSPIRRNCWPASKRPDKAVALHFDADWCPTCRAQEKVLNGWKGDSAVPGTLLIVNYDNDRELRKKLGVRTQSTVIVYKGATEKARIASEGGAVRGGILLGLFGIGAAVPLVAVAHASRSGFNAARGWVLQRIDGIKKAFGLFILLTGIAILGGADKWLEARVVAILPDAWVRATTLF